MLAVAGWLRERGATSVGRGGVLARRRRRRSAPRAGPATRARSTAACSRSRRRPTCGTRSSALSRRPIAARPALRHLADAADGGDHAPARAGLRHDPSSLRDAVELLSVPFYGASVEELARPRERARVDRRGARAGAGGASRSTTSSSRSSTPARSPSAPRATTRCTCVVRPCGGHAAFDLADPAWTAGVERAWLGALARLVVARRSTAYEPALQMRVRTPLCEHSYECAKGSCPSSDNICASGNECKHSDQVGSPAARPRAPCQGAEGLRAAPPERFRSDPRIKEDHDGSSRQHQRRGVQRPPQPVA